MLYGMLPLFSLWGVHYVCCLISLVGVFVVRVLVFEVKLYIFILVCSGNMVFRSDLGMRIGNMVMWGSWL